MGKVLTRTMAAAAGAAMLLPLAACGGSADAGKTTISFLSWDNEQIMKPFIDEFEKENPDIKVDFGYAPPTNEYIQTLQTRLVGNQAPDVFVITSEDKRGIQSTWRGVRFRPSTGITALVKSQGEECRYRKSHISFPLHHLQRTNWPGLRGCPAQGTPGPPK